MPDTDWRQKYRDSLLEMQVEENRWRQTEQALRRLIGRLCAAGMGVDPKLDEELSALAAANRRSAEAEELGRIAETLTMTVVAVDAVAPVPALAKSIDRPASAAIQTAVVALLNRLPTSRDNVVKLELLEELKATRTESALAELLGRVADLVEEQGDLLARERLQAGAVLGEVTRRLEEVARYLNDSNDASQHRFADAQSHNEQVMWQVRELSGEINSATELKSLQRLVGERLERVTQEVCEFRAREEHRLVEYNGHAAAMRARIADLEREARDLSDQLDDEKQVARLDPLTNVANRKSYDERFRLELQRCKRGANSVAMLLFDLDDFKTINDSYGHRAGDRVLQNVVKCFSAAARPEDFVARLGGEEFAVMIDGVDLTEAAEIAERIRGTVEALRFHFRGAPVKVTVSCGLTLIQPQDSPEAAYDRADAALYRAKHAGKNACIAA